MISPTGAPGYDQYAIEEMTPIMAALGLLDDEGVSQVRDLISRAQLASHTAYTHEGAVADMLETAAAKLAADPKLDAGRITKVAADVAAQSAVDQLCTQVYQQAVREARAVAFSNIGQLAATLTAQFDDVRGEFTALVPELVGVRDDRAAIDTERSKNGSTCVA